MAYCREWTDPWIYLINQIECHALLTQIFCVAACIWRAFMIFRKGAKISYQDEVTIFIVRLFGLIAWFEQDDRIIIIVYMFCLSISDSYYSEWMSISCHILTQIDDAEHGAFNYCSSPAVISIHCCTTVHKFNAVFVFLGPNPTLKIRLLRLVVYLWRFVWVPIKMY